MRRRENASAWAPVLQVRRVGAVVVGACLAVFGVLLLVAHVGFFTTQGVQVLGMTGNGLLAVLSLVVGALLIAAGILGGRIATWVTVVFGVLFLASGLVNVTVVGSSLNRLAFTMPNVVFSLVVGVLLTAVGGYGLFGGQLPMAGDEVDQRDVVDVDDELAAAEHAVAEHTATPEQRRMVAEDADRRAGERYDEAWRQYHRASGG